MFLRVITCALLSPAFAFGAGHPLELPTVLQGALDALRNGHYLQTLETARGLQETFPGHPLPYLIQAEANWGLIFCQTGHISSREIWNAADEKSSSFDRDFFQAVDETIAVSEALREEPKSAALGAFYEGLAHGVRARLHTLRAEALNSGKAGKQMRESLLQAAAQDPALQADAEAGLGVYNYYADVLSPLIKLFRFLLLIPGGDREKGLEQLRAASLQATLLLPEARNELARIYSLRENRPAAALPLFRSLADRYPQNAIYALSAAIQAERIGEKEIAADYVRKALGAVKEMDDVCRDRLEPASQQALERLQGKPGR
ncbi:MAG: hypothetical protein HY316_03765 [Acidobacteria bacterium]|nr:hypothetical protein [Acidobacteriota bacterium]